MICQAVVIQDLMSKDHRSVRRHYIIWPVLGFHASMMFMALVDLFELRHRFERIHICLQPVYTLLNWRQKLLAMVVVVHFFVGDLLLIDLFSI